MKNGRQKVVLITGASSGIGKAVAERLTGEGFRVYGTSRKIEPGQIAEVSILPDGSSFKMIHLDVTRDDSVQQAVDMVYKAEGRIDVLINNAGFGIAGALELTNPEEVQKQLDTNFLGVIRMCRAVLPVMRHQKDGRIINIGSVMGIFSIQYQSIYSVSKFAMEALTEALRIEVKPFGIKVSVVQAGDTHTGFVREFATATKDDRIYHERFTKSIEGAVKAEHNGHKPEVVAGVVSRMIAKKNPPVRMTVGYYKILRFIKRLVPDRLVEFVVERFY